MRHFLLFGFLLCATTSACSSADSAQEETTEDQLTDSASRHKLLGLPRDSTEVDELLLERKQYVLSYNRFRNSANWVAWHLTAKDFGDAPRYEEAFFYEGDLPADYYRVTHWDYSGSGFTRGHMVRSEERTRTQEDNLSTFKLGNILPQRLNTNTGAWYAVEKYCENLVKTVGYDLMIFSGGIYAESCRTDRDPNGNLPEGTCTTIGKHDDMERRVAVPTSFFKIIVPLPRGGSLKDVETTTRVVAVQLDNVDERQDWVKHITSVDKIEELTGYDFLTRLPPAVEDAVEAHVDRNDVPNEPLSRQ